MNDQKTERDGAAVRIPPPLLFVISITLGIALERYFPLPFPIAETSLRIAAGAVLGLLGLSCIFLSFSHFRRTGQAPEPWKSTPEIIREGIYRHTRNPMYLSLGLLQVGIGIRWENLWIVGLVFVSLMAVQYLAIRPEEAYLEEKFGNDYLAYKASVGRWLGRK